MEDLIDRIKRCVEKHPDWKIKRVCKSIRGASAEAVRKVKDGSTAKPKTCQSVSGIPEGELRARHDMLYQIRRGIEKLSPGVYPIESEFVGDYCAIKRGGFKHLLERPEFAEYHGRVGGLTYWGTKAGIARLKSDNVLI